MVLIMVPIMRLKNASLKAHLWLSTCGKTFPQRCVRWMQTSLRIIGGPLSQSILEKSSWNLVSFFILIGRTDMYRVRGLMYVTHTSTLPFRDKRPCCHVSTDFPLWIAPLPSFSRAKDRGRTTPLRCEQEPMSSQMFLAVPSLSTSHPQTDGLWSTDPGSRHWFVALNFRAYSVYVLVAGYKDSERRQHMQTRWLLSHSSMQVPELGSVQVPFQFHEDGSQYEAIWTL